jgi:hypothetical protein
MRRRTVLAMTAELFARLNRGAETFFTGIHLIKESRTSPPSGSNTKFGRLLWRSLPPLIHPRARVIIIWSAKSACTQTLIWFFHHLGHLRSARDFHIWPHDYRDYVYYYSELYRDAYRLDFSTFKVIRVVRDPYERAVSSFRHMLAQGFGSDTITKRLRYRNIGKTGLSFAAFLDCLENSDLTNCNPHYRIQRHPIEDVLPIHYLINVSNEDLFKRLNDIEPEIGLPPSDMAEIAKDWLAELHWHKRPEQIMNDGSDFYTRALTVEQARAGPWPLYEAFLTPEARERISRYYAIDLKTYFQLA